MKNLLFNNRFIFQFTESDPGALAIENLRNIPDQIAKQQESGMLTDLQVDNLRELDNNRAVFWLLNNEKRHEQAPVDLEEGLITEETSETLLNHENPALAHSWLKRNRKRNELVKEQLDKGMLTKEKTDELLSKGNDLSDVSSTENSLMELVDVNKWLRSNDARWTIINRLKEKQYLKEGTEDFERFSNMEPQLAIQAMEQYEKEWDEAGEVGREKELENELEQLL
ncbi:hypothetical protein KKA95_02740 [Patescibacteria group bacterium]|nr:hypothetical protein [Patescibacteria group bacterium]